MRILVEALAKSYGALAAVQGLSFTAEPGRVCGFLGQNGSGKSTTLRCMFGLARADAGRATFDGRAYAQLAEPPAEVGALLDPEAHHPDRTGGEHLRVLCDAAGLPLGRADEVLRLVELEGAADRRAGGYLLGMRQRLHLAAALLGDPAALLLRAHRRGREVSRALRAEWRKAWTVRATGLLLGGVILVEVVSRGFSPGCRTSGSSTERASTGS